MTQLTTAFLGVAHIHTPDFVRRLNAHADEITVKYVYDIDKTRGEATAAQLTGATYIDDPKAIFDDASIGSVVVCSETNQHLELVTKAAQAGKHIFCEKPIGLGARDAWQMAGAIQAAGVTFQTGFFQRSSGVNQFIKREVTAGHLGKITRMRYTNCHQAALAGWFDTDWRWLADAALAGGGALLDMGAHPMDLIVDTYLPVLGEVVQVASSIGNQGGRYGTTIDEYGTGLLTFASGASAVIEASWVDPQLRSPIEIFGTEGQIQVIGSDVHYYSSHVEGADGSAVTDLPPNAPHAFELFWDSLLGKPLQVPLITAAQAATGSSLMERLFQASGRRTNTGLAS